MDYKHSAPLSINMRRMVRPAFADCNLRVSTGQSFVFTERPERYVRPPSVRTGKGRIYTQEEVWERAKQDLSKENPWILGNRVPPCFWESKDNRVRAVGILVQKSGREGKSLRDITYRDFCRIGLNTLMRQYYRSSPFEAFLEAELVSEDQRTSFSVDKRMECLKLRHGAQTPADAKPETGT